MDEKSTDVGWRRHFNGANFTLEHRDPSRFVHGPWRRERRVSLWFLAYRVALALALLSTLLYGISMQWSGGKWFIFLTNWGYLLCATQACYAAVLVVLAFRAERASSDLDAPRDSGGMPLSYKIYWVLYNMAVPVAFFITIIYWAVVFEPSHLTDGKAAINYMFHIGNSVTVLLELSIGGPPSRLLHVLQPVAFGVTYLIFNVIYWAAGGTDPNGNPWVYQVLSWDNPGLAGAVTGGASVLMLFLHLFVVMCAGVRNRCRSRLYEKSASNLQQQRLSLGNSNKAFEP